MENISGRSLILAIGWPKRRNEDTPRLLRRVSHETKISDRSIKAAYYDEYISKKTLTKLRQAADHANSTAARFEALADASENEGRPRAEVEALRALARRFRGLDNGAGCAAHEEG